MDKKILVIGESCRDIFVYCDSFRLCPEAPVPVLNIIDQRENPGMAGNVRRNIESISGKSDIYTNKNWHEMTKIRYVHQETNHMFFRVDTTQKIERVDINQINFNYDAIVISDYNKGFLTKEDIQYICSNHNTVFMDTKKTLGDWANNALFIKINDCEYKNSQSFLTEKLSSKIIHTMGGNGCKYREKNYPIQKVEVKDLSGAGDSFISAFVVKFLETNDTEQSIIFANQCASKVVSQKGVTTIC